MQTRSYTQHKLVLVGIVVEAEVAIFWERKIGSRSGKNEMNKRKSSKMNIRSNSRSDKNLSTIIKFF